MQETELKFQVPAARSAALRRAVGTATAQTTPLRATYFDTPELHLARAQVALRLRQEGSRWVQTLKGRGDGLMQRLEHEVPLPMERGTPQLDLQRHAGTPAAAALAAALPAGAALQPLYTTDIQRLHRRVRFQGAVIEIAHDQGALLAAGQRVEVDEIEFELVSGAPAALPALAQRWAARHGLWWDCRTKSERGTRLALQRMQVPAVSSAQATWPRDAAPGAVWSASVHACLAHALPNAAELADGKGTPEHLHQLRLALRRLRSLLRGLAPWSAQPDAALALERDWRAVFARLGTARDADVWRTQLAPRLAAAGGPAWTPLPAGPGEDLAGIVTGADFTALLLRTLAIGLPQAGTDVGQPAEHPPDALALLRDPWRSVQRGARQFAAATADERHRTRKQVKRLRDLALALQPLLRGKPTRQLLRALRAASAALGTLNDLETAAASSRAQAQQDPQAWFAAGWLAASLEPARVQANDVMAALRKAPRRKALRRG